MQTSHLMNTYARLPISFETGKGAELYDAKGTAYLDAVSGIAVCSLGHAHPAISETLCKQSKSLIHTSNLYNVTHQTELANQLTTLSGMDRVFFSNSGAEANEAAIKIARKYAFDQAIKNPKIIVMENSFHGRTLATLSATANEKVRYGFYALAEDYLRVPFGDADAVKALSGTDNIVAILVEPIQGEGGVNVPPPGYLSQLREICDQNNWLLMIDEIQTGIGRTGKWFAHQHDNITPDVMTLAKALGNGFPIGACLAKGDAAEVLTPGNHGTTFGGNPLACAVGLTVLNIIEEHQFLKQVAQKGEEILEQFRIGLASNPHVTNIRGRGYMIGIELNRPCGELVKQAIEKQLLINVTNNNTIRLLPSFVMSTDQSNQLISTLIELINEFTLGSST